METMTDKQIKEWIKSGYSEVADGGFSAKVMSSLPEKDVHMNYGWIVWLFGLFGALLAYLSGALEAFGKGVIEMVSLMPEWLASLFGTLAHQSRGNNDNLLILCILSVILFGVWMYETVICDNC